MNTKTNRLDEIAERNSRSRVLDIAFAAMVAIMMVLSAVSLSSAAAGPLNAGQPTADQADVAHADDATCELEIVC